jgi:hypothetical protein
MADDALGVQAAHLACACSYAFGRALSAGQLIRGALYALEPATDDRPENPNNYSLLWQVVPRRADTHRSE